ncbi:MAG: DUF6166 domain-containing protein [Planctomycetota bacterium]
MRRLEYTGYPAPAGPGHVGHVTSQANGFLPRTLKSHDDGVEFGWGYCGGGPHDLARAILKSTLGVEASRAAIIMFRDRVIAKLPRKRWYLSAKQVEDAILQIGRDLVKESKS